MEADAQMARDLQAVEEDSPSDDSESDEEVYEDAPIPGLVQRNDFNQYQADDLEDHVDGRLPFNRECFKRMIARTFEDYYPSVFNTQEFDVEKYMKLVQDEQLEARFGVYLENSQENILTLRNMPWLDIGDLPESYEQKKSEAFQVFVVPKDTVPTSLHFTYSNWRRGYEKRSPMKKLVDMDFTSKHQLLVADLEDTIDKATELMKPYRGWIATMEIVKIALAVVGLIIACIVAVSVGWSQFGWVGCAITILVYMTLAILGIYFIKYSYNAKLWQSNFLLAIFCRAENNRHYLNLGLELRPGFLAKWIEVKVVNTEKHPDIISYFKQRFLQPAIDLRTKLAEKSMYKDENLVRQQRKIEAQIAKKKVSSNKERNQQEHNEVKAAVQMSDPNELS